VGTQAFAKKNFIIAAKYDADTHESLHL